MRELYFSNLFPKLDPPLFKGPFLFILHLNKARVGRWDFNSSQVYCLPIYDKVNPLIHPLILSVKSTIEIC